MVLIISLLFAFMGTTLAMPEEIEFDCTNSPDGLAWWGCWSYGMCRRGEHVQQDCVDGTRYDTRTQSCVNAGSAASPCNLNPDCSFHQGPGHRIAERQADQDGNTCSFYYTCVYGRYMGHQRCNTGTIYDESKQRCDFPENVPPPCGTFIGQDSRNNVNNNNNNNNNNFNNRFTNRFTTLPPPTYDPNNYNNQDNRSPYRNLFRGNVPSTNFNPQSFDPSLYGIAVDRFGSQPGQEAKK